MNATTENNLLLLTEILEMAIQCPELDETNVKVTPEELRAVYADPNVVAALTTEDSAWAAVGQIVDAVIARAPRLARLMVRANVAFAYLNSGQS